MKIKNLTMSMLFILSIGIWESEHTILPGPQVPQTFEINDKTLILGSGTSVTILKLPTLTLIGQFGTYGEGPGEFIPEDKDLGLTIFFQPDSLLVASRYKISHFTFTGTYLDECRAFHGFSHKSLSTGFVGLNTVARDNIVYHDITLFDQRFKIVTVLHSKRFWLQRNQDINPIDVTIPRICVVQDQIFYQNSTGNIEIANKNGKKMATTHIDFEIKRLTSHDRETYTNYYKSHPIYKEYYNNLKEYIKFPNHFPHLKFFDVDDSRIYMFTYHRKVNKTRIYICNFKGKLLKQVDLEMPGIDPFEVYPLARVSAGKLYQIKEDGDDTILWTTDILSGSK